jgi:hypothetical protein
MVDLLTTGAAAGNGEYAHGQFRGNEVFEAPTGFNGSELVDVLMGGAGAAQMQLAGAGGGAGGGGWSAAGSAVMVGGNNGGQGSGGGGGGGGVRAAMSVNGYGANGGYGPDMYSAAIQVEAPTGMNGTQIVDLAQVGSVTPNNAFAQTMAMASKVMTQNTKNERLRQDAYGAGGAHEGQTMLTSQAVMKQNTKNERLRQDAYGAGGAHEGQNMLTSQSVLKQNTKNERLRQDAYGAAGEFAYGTQNVEAVRAKQSTKREGFTDFKVGADTTFGHNTAPAAIAKNTRFSTKKGALVDFLMPSAAVGGTESTVTGAQNVGMSTNLTSRREQLYDSQFGFSPEQVQQNELVLGYYQQMMEHQNIRGYGNLEHPVAGAGYAFFMTQRECEN